MNINDLIFYIHYCNKRDCTDKDRLLKTISRKINHHEFILITGGNGSVTISNKMYKAEQGMLLYLKPDIFHCIKPDLNDPLNFISVHFSFTNVEFDNNKWKIKYEKDDLPLREVQFLDNYYSIKSLMRSMLEVWYEKFPGYEFVSKTMFQRILFKIFRSVEVRSPNYSNSLKIKIIIKFMTDNINKKITLSELSQLVNLSPTYLSKVFKKTTGYSIIEFFNKMKIDKAKELIIEGDKKIKEVAEIVGYKDEFYFSRIFKKIEGISPKEFCGKNVHEV
ncbi:AraC family transcriptional regulator [Clostridium sp. DMHC 10]|uniref:AraC family transcriptional regulator n=1 Tax=Clostridium sp. DMHC 10 TaxID=747377 RepID=UPI00069F6888|nr:AraC family transcriptional regulator [Clostridium sp. DMHC 10]KOF57372.1 AraC family transcriptional regulator [Clostridium sp. DMHC 10]